MVSPRELAQIKLSVIEVQLVNLKARRESAGGYTMNLKMQLEVRILDDQIKALETLQDETRALITEAQ